MTVTQARPGGDDSPDQGLVPVPSGTRRVVVGIDDSAAGVAALRAAVGMARAAGVPLLAVRAWALGLPRHGGRRRRRPELHPHVMLYFDGSEQRSAAAKVVKDSFLAAAGGIPADVPVSVMLPRGEPGQALLDQAVAGDMLVLGSTGARGHRLRYGSVSQYCAGRARCPVVLVTGDGRAVS